ncbi:MAG: lysophospholipid acyltransferase family protein [Planctomycetaceae bacterium]|nr:lysophospholipid acyltransferase family protein [Planctomycetaceae bacterium]
MNGDANQSESGQSESGQTESGQSESWIKRLSVRATGRLFRYALQCGPRLQNLRLLDMTGGFCPPLGPMSRPAILIMWHESILLPLGLGFHSPVALLVSQHRDANWLTMAGEGMGFDIVRGSTTRGGGAALRKLKELSQTHSMVITPDGPKGPRRTMNLGAIYLAAMLQLPLVPVGVGMARPWRLATWDQFAVPKPFHRARIIFGTPIHLPRRCEREQLEQLTKGIGQDLEHITEVAQQWADSTAEFHEAKRIGVLGNWVTVKSKRNALPWPTLNSNVEQLKRTIVDCQGDESNQRRTA